MLIIPAIDIKNGKCVRLTQGKFDEVKVYSDDPVIIARGFEKEGAQMIHIVDLDGAKEGKPVNLKTIKKIIKTINIPVEVGGGIRTKEYAKILLKSGASRVIIGTVALENKKLLEELLEEFDSRIVVALDTKNGILVTRGWQNSARQNYINVALELERKGVKRFIYTDVLNDGMLTRPNFKEIKKLLSKITIPAVVGGGVTTIDDVIEIKKLGAEGVIIGKAIYEGKLNLSACLSLCHPERNEGSLNSVQKKSNSREILRCAQNDKT